MKTADFLRQHGACREVAKWALSIGKDMSAVWEAMIEQGKHKWLLWTAARPGVFPDSTSRKLACRFVRDTPICDGTVWDLLTDERSRNAVEVAEAYADGKATEAELSAASAAAYDAAYDAEAAWTAADYVAASYAAYAAASYNAEAAWTAADAAASAAARAARAAVCAARTVGYVARAAVCAARTVGYVARAAADAERAAAFYDARAAADAERAAAFYDARADAYAAQVQMIAELGNPFKEELARD